MTQPLERLYSFNYSSLCAQTSFCKKTSHELTTNGFGLDLKLRALFISVVYFFTQSEPGSVGFLWSEIVNDRTNQCMTH